MKLLVTEARGGGRHEITCAPTLSVGELKEKLSRLSGVAVDEQDLRLMGDSLCDEATLAEQGVQAAALFATVGGLVLESSPLFIAATMITVVTMSVATAGFMGEIGDKKSTVSNNRR